MSRRCPLYALLFLLACLLGSGCLTRKSGFAVDATIPAKGTTYFDTVARLGNPTAVHALPQGGFDAVWSGTETAGGELLLGYSGLNFRLGRTQTAIRGMRLLFTADGRLRAAYAVGDKAPVWEFIPFDCD
ncbi:MAG: hypothetical protein RSD41_04100 [Kiritimatiellia bacterium]